MICPKCKSENVTVQMAEVGGKGKTNKSTVGLGGHAYNATRALIGISTLGLSNLVMPKATGKEKSKTKTKNATFAVCQNCGKTWKVG